MITEHEKLIERRKPDTLVASMRVCADVARPSPDDFTYLNDPAREMLREAIARIEGLLSQLDATRAERDGLAQALKPFAAEKLPSTNRTLIDYDRYGLRRAISPMELASKAAGRALEAALKHQGTET
jgi:hypothetical protein